MVISDATMQFLQPSTPDGKPRERLQRRLGTSLSRIIAEEEIGAINRLESIDDLTAIATLVIEQLSNSPLPADRRIRMALKGAQRFRALLARCGGTLDTTAVADLLNTKENAIHKMVSRRKLLAFKQNGVWAFPAAQFTEHNKPVEKLDELLSQFEKDVDNDSIVRFCLSTYEDTGKNPLSLLQEKFPVDKLAEAARNLFVHGAR